MVARRHARKGGGEATSMEMSTDGRLAEALPPSRGELKSSAPTTSAPRSETPSTAATSNTSLGRAAGTAEVFGAEDAVGEGVHNSDVPLDVGHLRF
uniref:Uncharacterized protein n=1 Tax=Mycena chlorophos TaxID=658473 RepID=A0ABQ0KUB7_MYCCL|nr:predicted protein [Mycena chlorophos]